MHYYEYVLQQNYSRLHPLLQARYSEGIGQTQRVEGEMRVVENGAALATPLLYAAQPTKFMFAEQGEHIPFKLQTTSKDVGDAIEIQWQRAFYFPNATRHYNTLMVVQKDGNEVLDYNGDGRFFASKMTLNVTAEGDLVMRSVAQYVRLGNRFVQLPRALEGRGMALESVDAATGALTIAVCVYNPLIGVIKQYRGNYTVV